MAGDTQQMMTDLNGNRVPVPAGATTQPIVPPSPAPASSQSAMMTDLDGNRVPVPSGAILQPLDPNAIPTGPINVFDPNSRNMPPGSVGQYGPDVVAYAKQQNLPLDVAARHLRGVSAPVPGSPESQTVGGNPLENLASGFMKGMGQTVSGVAGLAEKVPAVRDIPGVKTLADEGKNTGDFETHGTEQDIGKISENIMEFLAGDGALKGLSLAEKFGIASKIAKTAETSPNIAKALRIGMDSLRQGGVASGETLAKGGTPTQALEAGAGTAAGSEFLGTLGQGVGALYGVLKKATPEAIAAAKQAAADQGTALANEIANAPVGSPVENARAVSDQLQKSEDQMHAEYAQGLAQLTQEAANIQVPIAGSATQNTAKDLLTNSSLPESLQEAVKGVVPDSSKLDPLLTKLSDPKAVYTWPEMQGLYQSVGQTIRKLPYDSPVRTDLIHLRASINQTMIDAAEKSGNEDVSNAMKSMRNVYATKVSTFDTSAIKALKDKNPDAVADILLRKGSVVNINNLRSLIGDENMKPVEGQLLKKLIDDSSTSGVSKAGASVEGEFNPGVFVQKFNKLGPDVQSAIWGKNLPQVKQFLQVAAKVKTDSPLWGGMAKYMEHRAIYGVGVGVLGFGGTYSVTHSVKDAAIVTAALLTLQNPTWLKVASKVLGGAAEPAEVIKGGVGKIASKLSEGSEAGTIEANPKSVTPQNPNSGAAPLASAPDSAAIEEEPPKKRSAYENFVNNAVKRSTQEAYGQSVLDDMIDHNVSPQTVSKKFWEDTYFKLPAESQNRFQKYLQKLTGFKPGDTIGTNAAGRPVVAQDWADIAENILDIGNDASLLEGTERGLVSGMKRANDLVSLKSTASIPALEAAPKSSIQPIPAALKGNDKIPDESIIGHEYGHGASAIASGGKLEELRSNWHPQNMVDNAAASARVTWPAEGAKSPDEWLSKPDNMMNFVQNYLAGGVTQKVLDGIKPEENPGVVGDIASVKETLNKVGITDPKQQQDVIEYLQKDWENKLTTPNPKTGRTLGDIIKEYRQEREDGLPEERLASLRKIRDFTKEVQQHVHNAGSK